MAEVSAETRVVGYREIASRLLAAGFEDCFGLMGEDTAGLTTTLIGGGIRYRSARQENSAIAMADGFSRATGRVGLAIVSRGPGLLNALGAIATADRSDSSLLVITGEGPILEGGTAEPAFDLKSMDHPAAIGSVGVDCFRPRTAAAVLDDFERAVDVARGGRVAVFCLPVTFMEGEIPVDEPSRASVERRASRPVVPVPAGLERATATVRDAEKVIVLAGRGAWLGGAAAELIALADATGGLLATTLPAKSMFAGHPFDLGVFGGFAHRTARDLIAQADCVITFGAGLNRFTTAAGVLLDDAHVVTVDSDPNQLGLRYPAATAVLGDAGLVARALTERLEPRGEGAGFRTDAVRELLATRAVDELFADASTADKVDPRTLLIRLDELLPRERNVTIDCGHFVGYPAMYLDVPDPSCFFWSLQFGMLGGGHGMGLGVAFARPDDANVVVLGDGGALMTFGELETLARLRPNALVVILDDGAYIAEKHYLELHDEAGDEAVFGREVDFAGVAERLGVPSRTIRSVADLEAAAPAFAGGGPFVLDVKIPLMRAGWYVESLTGEFDEQ